MAARNDETWSFVVEWFDPMPRLKKSYLLKYFVQQHQVEMVDLKSKKIFLKRSPCTEEITPEDLAVGKKVIMSCGQAIASDLHINRCHITMYSKAPLMLTNRSWE